MSRAISRREFLRNLALLSAGGLAASACGGRATPQSATATALTTTGATTAAGTEAVAPAPAPTDARAAAPTTAAAAATTAPAEGASAEAAYLAVARGAGADPAELTRRAVAAVGGIERFVKQGADVILKPNICNAYHGPEYASTTNPQVLATLVSLCLGAGAKRVRVIDYPFAGAAQKAYVTSGIEEAVTAAGGQMEVMSRMKFRDIELPAGVAIKKWPVYGDILDADVVINVPIAKNHGSAQLTLGMKNLMGVVENRNGLHARGLHQSIADLSTAIKPQLTLIDAVRMLMHNGPTGGNLDDVKQADTVIASTDVVAADAYATTLFGMQPDEIDYIRFAAEMGLGTKDLQAIKIEEISV